MLQLVSITVASDSSNLQLGIDESYSLSIAAASSNGTISSNTIYGAMRALETLSQLIDFDFHGQTYAITTLPVSIQDYPRFPWR